MPGTPEVGGSGELVSIAADTPLPGSPVLDAPDVAYGAAPGSAPSNGNKGEPSYEEIAERAYHLYLERGGTHGHDFRDWLEAERQLRQRRR